VFHSSDNLHYRGNISDRHAVYLFTSGREGFQAAAEQLLHGDLLLHTLDVQMNDAHQGIVGMRQTVPNRIQAKPQVVQCQDVLQPHQIIGCVEAVPGLTPA